MRKSLENTGLRQAHHQAFVAGGNIKKQRGHADEDKKVIVIYHQQMGEKHLGSLLTPNLVCSYLS